MNFFNFLYQFFFFDQAEKRLSHTKFWSHIGYALTAWSFVYAQTAGKALDFDFYLIMGTILIGNRTLLRLVSLFKGSTINLTK